MISFGQLDFFVDTFLNIVHHAAQVTSAGVGRDHDLTLHILTVDRIGSHGRNDICHVRERNLAALSVIDHQVLDTLHRTAVIFICTYHQVEGLALFIDLRYDFSRHVYRYKFIETGQRNAILGQHLPTGNDFQFRAFDLLLHIQVGHTFHIRNCILDLITDRKHAVQIVTEQLDRNAGLRTAQHRINTVTDRLSDLNVGTRNHRQLLTYIGQHLGMRTVFQFKGRFDLGNVDSQGMFVQFRTTGLTRYGLNLRNRQQQFLGLTSDLV